LILTAEACLEHGSNAKMNPPLGIEEDIEAVYQGILDGTIDALGTDHAPHSKTEKDKSLSEAFFGITGFETALPLYLEKFFHSGSLKPWQLISCLTDKSIKCLNIRTRTAKLKPGELAHLTIIDPNKEWIFTHENTQSKSQNSPFYGRKLKGKAVYTIVNGEIKWKN